MMARVVMMGRKEDVILIVLGITLGGCVMGLNQPIVILFAGMESITLVQFTLRIVMILTFKTMMDAQRNVLLNLDGNVKRLTIVLRFARMD